MCSHTYVNNSEYDTDLIDLILPSFSSKIFKTASQSVNTNTELNINNDDDEPCVNYIM